MSSKSLQNNKTADKVKTMSRTSRFFKRTFDIVCSIAGLVLFSWLMLIIWIAIKWEDHGPAIFHQERIGLGGKPFTLHKFRSMIVEAEADGAQLYHAGDDRLTKVGRFIRDHHIDELPQLWNVLKGEMSFVGYRPERQVFIDQIMEHDARYAALYATRPGLFSLATLYNGYTDTMEKMLERLRMDLEYMEKATFWLDMKIITLTGLSILTGKKF